MTSAQHPAPVALGQSLYPSATCCRVVRDGVRVAVRILAAQRAELPPLLLLHGHPQSMAMWHAVAPALAERRHVVMMDLRGYGDSDRPKPGIDDVAYSKREMAADAVHVMRTLGHAQFDVLAHDRGARVTHRMAVDWPDAVQRVMLLDIAPTLAMYEGTTEAFARAYWHWFFLIQPNGLPERWIEQDPVAYLRACMGSRRADGLSVFSPAAMAEYERCVALPGSGVGVAADYRASAGIDLVHDRADVAAGIHMRQPLRVLWGAQGVVERCFDVLALWRARAPQVTGRALPCSHYIAEELPQDTLAEALAFFN